LIRRRRSASQALPAAAACLGDREARRFFPLPPLRQGLTLAVAAAVAGSAFAAAGMELVPPPLRPPGPRLTVALPALPMLTELPGPEPISGMAEEIPAEADPAILIEPDSAKPLAGHFLALGYSLDRLREQEAEVPRLYAVKLPPDLAALEPGPERKRTFIKLMLPLILATNERILIDRARLVRLEAAMAEGVAPGEGDVAWLESLALQYEADPADLGELKRRVDVIPASLALAQAALETGWGTSRPAIRGHALFGMMTVIGGQVVVRRFDDLPEAVAAYVHNLNIHNAYAALRQRRAEQRGRYQEPDGHDLARHLTRYSERGMDYVRDVQKIINTNQLKQLDSAKLAG